MIFPIFLSPKEVLIKIIGPELAAELMATGRLDMGPTYGILKARVHVRKSGKRELMSLKGGTKRFIACWHLGIPIDPSLLS